jgi:hypothetical protein
MHTVEIHVSGGRELVQAVRWELFLFHDVRDVLATDRPDVLTVIYRGEPDLPQWLEALRLAGFGIDTDAAA